MTKKRLLGLGLYAASALSGAMFVKNFADIHSMDSPIGNAYNTTASALDGMEADGMGARAKLNVANLTLRELAENPKLIEEATSLLTKEKSLESKLEEISETPKYQEYRTDITHRMDMENFYFLASLLTGVIGYGLRKKDKQSE